MEKGEMTKNLLHFATHSVNREKKVWGRKTHSNKQTFTKVKCYHCQSEGCKACEFSGLITIK